jgi:hypothetical protein
MDYAKLLREIVDGDDNTRERLLQLDEAAVTPLIDQFYAGVDEATGLVIITLLNDIGGWEARNLLEDVLHLTELYKYESWRVAARAALAQYE